MRSADRKTTALVPVWLYVLFFLSGTSGLMYEVVWVRMLTRILGNTVYATSTVLTAFMAGLALGSYGVGRWIDRTRRPLAWYVGMEVGIGLSALASLALPDRLVVVYRWIFEMAGGSRGWLTAGQVVVASGVLLLPTALMGATLPVLCAVAVRYRGSLGPALARLYGLNTLGGVVGVLASGFVLLGELGETCTILIGVGLNLAVALGALGILRGRPVATVDRAMAGTGHTDRTSSAGSLVRQTLSYPERVRRGVVICFAVNGFVALGAEVIWSRMLLLYQGTSIYAFSAMLAVLLASISFGSLLVGQVIGRMADPLAWLARLYVASAVIGALALHCFDKLTWLHRPELWNPHQLHPATFVLAPIILLGPIGLVWGAIFPVSARCFASTDRAVGRSVGELYAWNTVGCIAGSLIAGFVLIPLLGSSRSAIALAVLSLMSGLVLVGIHPSGLKSPRRLLDIGCAAAAVLLVATAGDPYYRLIRRQMDQAYPDGLILDRHVEDVAGATTAFGGAAGNPLDKQLWVNGHGMSSLATATKMMAHLPIWLAENPRQVLVICFGMGTTVRSALCYPELEVWAVELVPAVVDCFGFYHPDGPALLRRPKLHVVLDDGRNFLLMHEQQFDVITIDPAPPLYSAGTVNLYSREFFQLCRQRIRPGGSVCLWLPPTNWTEAKMILRTFVEVFEFSSVWGGPDFPGFYLCGSDRPRTDVMQSVQQAYADPAIGADLNEWDSFLDRPEKFLYLYLCDGKQLDRFLRDAPVITDDHPYTEFPLWRACWDRKLYPVFLDAIKLKYVLAGSPNPG